MTRVSELPGALDALDEVVERIDGSAVVFCDYDGTLTPIVDDPDRALLPHEMRDAITRLGDVAPVAIVSGRDVMDVRGKVGIDGIYYAGSHGFDIVHPSGERTAHPEAASHLPSLDAAEGELADALSGVGGARVERKRYAIAVHFRQTLQAEHERVADAVRRVARLHSDLRITGGKMIWELRPDVDWDKGKAVLWLIDALGMGRSDVVPIYVGDDLTDEDAFRVLGDRGVGFIVHGSDHETSADYALPDPDAVRRLLEHLTSILGGS